MQTAALGALQRVLAKTAESFLRLEKSGVAFFVNFRDGLREGARLFLRYNALARLSGAELAKRGLTRAKIAKAALSDDAPQRK